MSNVLNGRVGKKRPQRSRRQVLRMMAIMQDGNNKELPKEFLDSGRTGRRNAMPEILSQQDVRASTADLPARLEALATSDSVMLSAHLTDEEILRILETLSSTRRDNEFGTHTIIVHERDSEFNMEDCDSDELLEKFLNSKCAGRRLALGEIKRIGVAVGSSDPNSPQPGPSNKATQSEDNKDAQKPSGS